jgi:hypothetical protein
MTDNNQSEPPKSFSGTVRFDYIKSNFFRVVHVDGVHGGVRPSADSVHIAFFNERNAIPKAEEHQVEGGKLGEQTLREGRVAIVREVEFDAILSIETAKSLRNWLDQKIALAEKIKQANNTDE